MRRLWYDVRSQALFEESLRVDAREIDDLLDAMIWRILNRFAELVDRRVVVTESLAYAAFGGAVPAGPARACCRGRIRG